MSYSKKIEYRIVPDESFAVIRNCSGCGKKVHYVNTKRFRVNANGNKLDIWLIYQCENCKHTLNLTIYERQKASSVPKEAYLKFLDNNETLAEEYGRNTAFFKKNKAEVDYGSYHFEKQRETENAECQDGQQLVVIKNPFELKLRPERQLADALSLSGSYVKKQIEMGSIKLEESSSQRGSAITDTIN